MSSKPTLTYCQELAGLVASCDPDDPDQSSLNAIEAHVATCEICKQAELALNATVQAFRNADPDSVSKSFEESMVDRLCRIEREPGDRS
jgi:hypothetical protein